MGRVRGAGAEPVLALPHRRYHLFRATLAAHEVWVEDQFFEQSANLVWPDGHDWCLATEIDFGFTLLGEGWAAASARSRTSFSPIPLEAFEVGVDDNMSWSGDAHRNPGGPDSRLRPADRRARLTGRTRPPPPPDRRTTREPGTRRFHLSWSW